jgi:hypothetical protein
MLTQLQYTVSTELLQEAAEQAPLLKFTWTINQPTGHFFYDPWVIKPEYANTAWAKLLESLPFVVGQARLIGLDPATSYHSHADIDDRYHLNITGENCYLFDFDNEIMHPVQADGIWYEMDAGRVHSASNFGRVCRSQLVVRKLLEDNVLDDAIPVTIIPTGENSNDSRFLFDQHVSPWLNRANKKGNINNFNYTDQITSFNLKASLLDELRELLPTGLEIK